MSLVRCSGSRLHEPCSHLTRFPGQTKCKLRAAHTRAICKYSRNPWCRLAFDGNVLALTANEITPPLTGRLQPWIQPVDATSLLNRSAGVWYSKVFLGRSFNLRATSLS